MKQRDRAKTRPVSTTCFGHTLQFVRVWSQANRFGRVAKVLLTSTLALSATLGMTISSKNQPTAIFDAAFVEALRANQMSSPEPLNLDRTSQFETERQLETERAPQRQRQSAW